MGLASILAWWTGGDQSRIIGLMRQSGLNNRKKWDRPDYLPRTVRNAIIDCTLFYGDGSYTSTADGLETEYAKVKAKEKSGVITSITEDNGDFTPHTCALHTSPAAVATGQLTLDAEQAALLRADLAQERNPAP